MLSAHATQLLGVGSLALLAVVGLMGWYLVAVRGRPRVRVALLPVRILNFFLARILWRAKVIGSLSLQPGQGAVIVSNHRSPVDPCFIALAADRVVGWMVAKEYCQHPLMPE